MRWARWCVLGLCLNVAATASPAGEAPGGIEQVDLSERIRSLFNIDPELFDWELKRRFQYSPPPPPPQLADEREGRVVDARYFASFPDFDRAYGPAERTKAQRLAARLAADAASLSHEQFVLRIAEIAALADNAHTSIASDALRKNTPRIPVRAFLFADGLYVLRAVEAHSDLLGARVEAIEGRPIEEIYTALERYLPGPARRRRLQLLPVLESPGLLHAAGLAGSPNALQLTLRAPDGRLIEKDIQAEERGPAAPVMNSIRLLFPAPEEGAVQGLQFANRSIPTYLQNRTELFTTAALPLGGFYIGIAHNSDSDEQPIGDFLQDALTQVRTEQPSFVALDMRMNGGGDYTKTYAFARALPAAARGGPIYVLTSPWTFSAAITTVAALEDSGGDQVTIVGEEVGDRLGFWAEGGSFILPNTNIAAHYSAARHDYSRACADRTECFWLNEIYPVQVDDLDVDIAAPLSFGSWRAGRDPAMEAILEREKAREDRE